MEKEQKSKIFIAKLARIAMVELQVKDATEAQNTVRRHFDGLYGSKLHEIKFSKTWLQPGSTMDLWLVEGDIVVAATLMYKRKHFKMEINNASGEVLGVEENDTK